MADFSWESLIGPAIQAGSQLVGGLINQSSQEDQQKESRANALRDNLYNLEIAKIKAGYAGGSGSSGGGGGGGGDNIAKLMAAMNNQIGVSQQGAQSVGGAYNSLANLVQRGYLGG